MERKLMSCSAHSPQFRYPSAAKAYAASSHCPRSWLYRHKQQSNTVRNCRAEDSADDRQQLRRNHFKGSWSMFKSLKSLFLIALPKVYADTTSEELHDDTSTVTSGDSVAVNASSNIITDKMIDDFMANETGQDRIKRMFAKRPYGGSSPELALVQQVAFGNGAMSFLIASFHGARTAREEFVSKNRSTVYATNFQAARRLNDAIWITSTKKGFKWGAIFYFFTGSSLLIAQMIAVYRNKSSPLEYIIGVGTVGGLCKLNWGPRGMLTGFLLGSALGSVAGVMTWGLMAITGETQEMRTRKQVQEDLEHQEIYQADDAADQGSYSS